MKTWHCVFTLLIINVLLIQGASFAEKWSDVRVRLLPDSSFAAVEVKKNGERFRHCPHHDVNGNLVSDQLIFELGIFHRQAWMDENIRAEALKHLEKHYEMIKGNVRKTTLESPVDINSACLTDLVALPRIGPVLAVKIEEFRQSGTVFLTIEDIQKVEGVGSSTFRSIRHYIRVE